MADYKSVRFRCENTLLNEVDNYRTRYRCRTQIIENALRNYIPILAEHDKKDHMSAAALSSNWRSML